VLAFGAALSAVVALGQAIGSGSGLDFQGTQDCLVYDVDDYCADDQLVGRAPARVLDIDDRGGPSFGDGPSSTFGVTVDVEFEASGEHVVTSFEWPARAGVLPRVGEVTRVAYDPQAPEDLLTIASALDAGRSASGGPGGASGGAAGGTGSPAGAWEDGRGAAWLGGGFTLAGVALLLTWWWARRAPAPEHRTAQPTAWVGPGGYGYGGYGGYGYGGYGGYGYGGYGYGPGPGGSGPGYGGPGYGGPGYGGPGYGGPGYGYGSAGSGYPAPGSLPQPSGPRGASSGVPVVRPGTAPASPQPPGPRDAAGSAGTWLAPR
jgi:hypothetical protein